MCRRGRPTKDSKYGFTTQTGEFIEGLRLRANGRFYPVGVSAVSFGSDEATAIMKYRLWAQQQNGTLEPLDDVYFGEVANYKLHIRTLILTDPKQAAIELNVPHLADYPEVKDAPEMTLPEYGEFYLSNKRNKQGQPLDGKHKKNSARWWSDFCDFVGVRHARDITADLIRAYRDEVMQQFDNGMSAAWVKSRFVKVKAIVNYCLTHVDDDKDDLRKLLDLCKMLESPESVSDPTPISVADFHKLLAVAKPREKAMLLLGLNAAMHGGEVAEVRKSELDLDARTFAARRSKNAHPRVAKLWTRVVRAIKSYMKAEPHSSGFLFVSRTGNPMTGEAFRQRFTTLKNQAGITVTFEGFRDAAYTIMDEVDHTSAKYVAGHKTGMSDKYVLRQANSPKVVACCRAVEKHYFGGKQ